MPSHLLSPYLSGSTRALADLHTACRGLAEEPRKHLEALVGASPAPSQLLHYLAAFRMRHAAEFEFLVASTFHLRAACAVFSYSRFLSESCLEHPEWLCEIDGMDRARSAPEFTLLLRGVLDRECGGRPEPLQLARFRRRQILRILVRDVLGLAGLAEVTEELSQLADSILETAYQSLYDELAARHGAPAVHAPDGSRHPCGMSVIALGKLGGRELNYSSDIDLMFVYTGNGETTGAAPLSNKEFFKKIANQYSDLLSIYTAEGMCYRVDLRLRPDGSLGEVCMSLDGALKYYRTRARDWELQMMIKGRVAAGDWETGRRLLEAVEPRTYSSTTDFSAVEAVSETRERIGEKLAARRGRSTSLDVKLAPGGIRDIEFLAQCLQRLHGARAPWVRHGGTLLALSRLSDKNLLSSSEYSRLAAAYQFLRHLEHRLQVADDRQTHSLPVDPVELEILARRMPREAGAAEASAAGLLQELNAHLEAVLDIYERVIHAQRPTYYALAPAPAAHPAASWDTPPAAGPRGSLIRTLDKVSPAFAAALASHPLRRGAAMFEYFLDRAMQSPGVLAEVEADPETARKVLDIIDLSPYFAEQLARDPGLVEELRAPAPRADEIGELPSDAASLRRSFRRLMFRIQAASICSRVPVFETLKQTSGLADAAIRAAYGMAVGQSRQAHAPADAAYGADKQMMVIALGRLGMGEFDLCSDADLVFVLPDADNSEQEFWARAASRLIDILTAYTGDGQLFSVDTRLRPNGSAGTLVQTESSFREYFDRHAEAWEGIAYMKARAVAGDIKRATQFLHDLQEVDWRKYGQSGRSRADLRNMRVRLEKEQGPSNPLKAGSGAYYDIDFLLLYLRLKGAGIFYEVLNTPARIDVVEKMGHLDRADAEFLRDTATFYRAVDHGLRVYSGHAGGSLPGAESHLEAVTELVHRWTPPHLHHQPLAATLASMRHRTREIFDRLFG